MRTAHRYSAKPCNTHRRRCLFFFLCCSFLLYNWCVFFDPKPQNKQLQHSSTWVQLANLSNLWVVVPVTHPFPFPGSVGHSHGATFAADGTGPSQPSRGAAGVATLARGLVFFFLKVSQKHTKTYKNQRGNSCNTSVSILFFFFSNSEFFAAPFYMFLKRFILRHLTENRQSLIVP